MSTSPPVQTRVSPFYEALREQLRAQYIAGRSPGDRLPSERQLAKQFESSPMTVGRILQEFQAQGLLERVQGKGSFVKEPSATPGASPVPGGHYHGTGAATPQILAELGRGQDAAHVRVGEVRGSRETPLRHTVIVASLGRDAEIQAREYWSHRIVSMAELKLQRAKVRTTIINRYDHTVEELQALFSRLKGEGVDSALFLNHGLAVDRDGVELPWRRQVLRLKHEMGAGLTVANVHFDTEAPLPFDSVTFDGREGSFLATTHLAERGHGEICFLGRALDSPWMRDRLEGFWQAMELHDLDNRPGENNLQAPSGRVFYSDESLDDTQGYNDWPVAARDVVQRFFAHETARKRFTGIVALNDQIAVEFIRVARELGFKVPQDFSVVGFDDRMFSKADGLTTVRPPIEELGEVAAELLLKRDGALQNMGKLNVTLNPSLVVRSSTRALNQD